MYLVSHAGQRSSGVTLSEWEDISTVKVTKKKKKMKSPKSINTAIFFFFLKFVINKKCCFIYIITNLCIYLHILLVLVFIFLSLWSSSYLFAFISCLYYVVWIFSIRDFLKVRIFSLLCRGNFYGYLYVVKDWSVFSLDTSPLHLPSDRRRPCRYLWCSHIL